MNFYYKFFVLSYNVLWFLKKIMTNKPIIKVKNLIKDYGSFRAVNGISFEVFEGEIFGLLGPNGAGKTTTLEIMETLRDETEGDVEIFGYSINKEPNKIKSIIGIQLQSAGFYPGLSLTELLHMMGALYGIKVNPDKLLSLVGLKDKARAKYDKLSGGQKQRFSICTTLINKPKVIFLDEPTTGLDPQARRNLWGLIREIKSEGVTVVLTTHYMDEAEELCNRIAIIDSGKILKLNTPVELIADLIKSGFKKEKIVQEATLEDVFLNLTGKELREV